MIRIFLVSLILVWSLAAPRHACAQGSVASGGQDITPPFGLEWGEAEERLEPMIQGAKAKIVEKRIVEGRDMWTVEGLIQANLRRTVFYFRNDQMVEVELQYQNTGWIDTDYNSFLTQLRGKVEQRFGEGKLIARSKTQVNDVTQTLVGYKWSGKSGEIEVVYFSAENPAQVYRTVSLHYKAVE